MLTMVTSVTPSPFGGMLTRGLLHCGACGGTWRGSIEDAVWDNENMVLRGGRFVAYPFRCPCCEMVSHNATDIAERYCGNCHDWTGVRVVWPPDN